MPEQLTKQLTHVSRENHLTHKCVRIDLIRSLVLASVVLQSNLLWEKGNPQNKMFGPQKVLILHAPKVYKGHNTNHKPFFLLWRRGNDTAGGHDLDIFFLLCRLWFFFHQWSLDHGHRSQFSLLAPPAVYSRLNWKRNPNSLLQVVDGIKDAENSTGGSSLKTEVSLHMHTHVLIKWIHMVVSTGV